MMIGALRWMQSWAFKKAKKLSRLDLKNSQKVIRKKQRESTKRTRSWTARHTCSFTNVFLRQYSKKYQGQLQLKQFGIYYKTSMETQVG